MAQHDPVEDALNARKARARRVEAGAAVDPPNEDALDITRKFLTGGQRLPSQAAPIARRRAFGQQGVRQRGDGLIEPVPLSSIPLVAPTGAADTRPTGSLSDRFFNLPGPVGFAQTPQGRAILQRILSLGGRR